MKQMLLVLFTLAAIFSIEAADSIFRVNIDGRKSRIILSPEKDISSMKASTWSWIKDSEEKKFTLTATSGKNFPPRSGSSIPWPLRRNNPEASAFTLMGNGLQHRKIAPGFCSIKLSWITTFTPTETSRPSIHMESGAFLADSGFPIKHNIYRQPEKTTPRRF